MANATPEQGQCPPEGLQQALLGTAEASHGIAKGIVETEVSLRALTANHGLATVAADDAGDKGTRRLAPDEQAKLLATLKARLGQKPAHYTRPEGIIFADVERALEAHPVALWSLSRLEETGGAPDIMAIEADAFVFADCSEESPAGRRDCVYDKAAEALTRGTVYGNAVDMAEEFDVEILSPESYRQMQRSGKFDRKTWSWIKTDAETRSRGAALCGGRFEGHVYVDQCGAHSYRDDGAWRGRLRVQKVS